MHALLQVHVCVCMHACMHVYVVHMYACTYVYIDLSRLYILLLPSQIVSCSGYGKDGSLRVVRSGVGLNEQASIDLSLVKGKGSLPSIYVCVCVSGVVGVSVCNSLLWLDRNMVAALLGRRLCPSEHSPGIFRGEIYVCMCVCACA